MFLSFSSKLKSLSLVNTQVTDTGLALAVDGCTHLETLDLRGTQVTDAGVKPLTALTKLRWLYIGDTQITSAGRDALQAALPGIVVELP